jgi:hypothetical protein
MSLRPSQVQTLSESSNTSRAGCEHHSQLGNQAA